MARVSPTLEGFRAAVRRPSLALGEITWRWVVGATAIALFFFGLFEYLSTLPVNRGELFFLRTRQPYLVAEAILHILRGNLDRAATSAILAALCMALLWIIAASLGRVATVAAMLDYIREELAGRFGVIEERGTTTTSRAANPSFLTLLRLNFLRVVLTIATVVGVIGAAILAGAVSPESNPQPGLAFFLLLSLATLVWLAWSVLNWVLSLAAIFAVRDREDALGATTAAVGLCRERLAAVVAVSAWTGLAHLVLFVGATTAASMALGFAGVLPGRLVALAVILVTLAYFAVADWLYTARLAGYLWIAEMPEALLHPLPPPIVPSDRPAQRPLQTTIDRDEPILSDVPISVPIS